MSTFKDHKYNVAKDNILYPNNFKSDNNKSL